MLFGLIVSSLTELTPNYLVLALCGVILAAFSQIGDLIASLLKREHGIKDYGKIFPGHGGVMDRFDSILSIATVLMAICIVFPPFA
jgi:phosphatidate cytidylyltransferase